MGEFLQKRADDFFDEVEGLIKKGHNFIEITNSELEYGMYFYSLISSGYRVETKKMIQLK